MAMRWFFRSIHRTLHTVTISILVVTALLVIAVGATQFRDAYRAALMERAVMVGKSLHSTVHHNLDYFPLDAFTGMETVLADLVRENRDLAYCLVADRAGRVLYDDAGGPAGRQVGGGTPLFARDADGKPEVITRSMDGVEEAVIPILEEGVVIGSIHVGMPGRLIEDQVTQLLVRSGILLVGALLAAVALMYFLLTRLVTAPITRLTRRVAEVQSGKDLEASIRLDRDDELARLAEAFNTMMGRLKTQYESLEEQVAERTRKLAESETRFRSLSELSVEGLIIHRKGVVVDSNAAVERMFGYTHEEFQALSPAAVVAEECLPTVMENIQNDVESPYEVTGVRKDGSRFPIEIHARMIERDGERLRVTCVQDISERKEAERLKEVDARRLEMLLDLNREAPTLDEKELLRRSLDIAVSITNSEIGYLHLVNEDQQTLTLSTWNDAALKLCTAAFDTHYPIEQAGIWADAIRLKHPVVHNDYPSIPDKPGYPEGHFPVLRHMSAPVMEGGKVHLIVGVGNKEEEYDDHDVTQLQLVANEIQKFVMRRRIELELEAKTLKLQRSNADLEKFAYVSSHDLREPLRMVSSYLQLLEKKYGGALDKDALDYIDFAVTGAKRMDSLIKDLLQYSRVETHGEPLKAVDSEEVLEEALDNLQAAIDEAPSLVTYDNLPVVMADHSQLMRLFQNLVGNAIKYQDPDATPEIHIGAEIAGDEVVFSVRDNGIGIDAQFFERVFVIFQRLHGRHEYSGTGVGLAICKRIVERHGGRIWVESLPGEGATFFFTLPAG